MRREEGRGEGAPPSRSFTAFRESFPEARKRRISSFPLALLIPPPWRVGEKEGGGGVGEAPASTPSSGAYGLGRSLSSAKFGAFVTAVLLHGQKADSIIWKSPGLNGGV